MLLTVAGLQVPVMPLFEVVGKTGTGAPLHIGRMGSNVGNALLLTVTVRVVVVAHNPGVGVKV